jgi:hypothetical protein
MTLLQPSPGLRNGPQTVEDGSFDVDEALGCWSASPAPAARFHASRTNKSVSASGARTIASWPVASSK